MTEYVGAKGDVGRSAPVWCPQHLCFCTDAETKCHKFYADKLPGDWTGGMTQADRDELDRLTAAEASDTMSPEDADRMERAAIALERVTGERNALIVIVQDAVNILMNRPRDANAADLGSKYAEITNWASAAEVLLVLLARG